MSPPPNCASCLDPITSSPPIRMTSTTSLCLACFDLGIRPNFHAALRHEASFPVMFSGKILHLDDFAHLFSEEFKAAWEIKVREYNTSIRERLYCRGMVGEGQECGEFLGAKGELGWLLVKCGSCGGFTCKQCCLSVSSTEKPHECDPVEAKSDPFKDLERGKEYQACPNEDCGIKVALREGCNDMKCSRCKTRFCYICGERTAPGHWAVGKPCPRWGEKGDPKAQFDDDNHEANYADPDEEPHHHHTAEEWAEMLAQMEQWEEENALDAADLALRREELRVAMTPQGFVLGAHLHQLAHIHTRVMSLPASRRTARIHDLIHLLVAGIEVYTADVRAQRAPAGHIPHRFRPRNLQNHTNIVHTIVQLGPDGWAGFEELWGIWDVYRRVWSEDYEFDD